MNIKNISRITKVDWIFAIIIFSFLMLPFWEAIPYLDGNIDFVKTNDLYTGGIPQYLSNWQSVHPPFKFLLTTLSFYTFGVKPISYNFVGIIFGILGIIGIYYLTLQLFGKDVAKISALLLATFPLFLSVGIFSLIDYILTIFLILSLLFYAKRQLFAYGIVSSLAVLTKETGLLLPISIVIIEIVFFFTQVIRKKTTFFSFSWIFLLLPFVVIFSWFQFLNLYGKGVWSDWIFAETANKGAFYTILYNLITLDFLNKYAYQHWLQFFFLNFHWIYWLLFFLGLFSFFLEKDAMKKTYHNILAANQNTKTLLSMFLFFISYLLTVLTFQTYTIPRYALPLVPLLIIGTSLGTQLILTRFPKYKNVFSISFISIIAVSLFSSSDPLSLKFWGKIEVLGQNIYALNHHLAGNDGITYNMQYLFIAKRRTDLLTSTTGQKDNVLGEKTNMQEQAIVYDCSWVFPDPNNDRKITKILKLMEHNSNFLCKQNL